MKCPRLRTARLSLLAMMVLVVNVGCNALDTRATIDRLEQERLELTQTKHRLESSLASCEGEQATYRREIGRLQSELALANQRIEALPATDSEGGEPVPAVAEDDGVEEFGNVPGVSARRELSGEILLTVDQSILFASGKSEVRKDGKATLTQIGQILANRFPAGSVRVAGHTDSTPIKKSGYPSNWELSTARACAVVRFLIGMKAVAPPRASVSGHADQRPVAPNDTDAGRAANRRVEIYVTP